MLCSPVESPDLSAEIFIFFLTFTFFNESCISCFMNLAVPEGVSFLCL